LSGLSRPAGIPAPLEANLDHDVEHLSLKAANDVAKLDSVVETPAHALTLHHTSHGDTCCYRPRLF
jgi:hypothetical protein